MFNLLHPGFLWLAALAVPLVVLYLLKARRRPHTLTALWLWREAQQELEARVPFRRLRRDWLLWLQLLILALLVLAAAGPYRRALGGGGDVAVVVDASASMLAGDRPAQLARALGGLIDGLGASDRMALVRAASRPEVLAPLGSDRRGLLAAAARACPGSAPAELAPAVELAESLAGAGGTVVVITDPAGEVPAAAGRLQVVRVGEAAGNVGIVALGVRPSDASGRDHQVFVRLKNASRSPAAGTLRLRADGGIRDAAELELAAGEEAGYTLRLVGPAAAAIEVEWRGVGDALAADDRAYWLLEPAPERRYRLRAGAGPFLRRALEATSGWRPAAAGEAADLEILMGAAPADQGPPFLWIDPPAGGEAAGAAVLRWDKTHPALRFVDLRALRLARVPRLARPPGARVLAESTAGPLVLEGSHRQRRYLLWAFDPMDTDLPLRVAWPLMVRHALEHLAPAGGPLDGGVATGAAIAALPVPWPSPEDETATTGAVTPEGGNRKVVLTSPSGAEVPLVPRDGALRLPPLEETGVWRLSGAGLEVRFAASLLDAGESDLTASSPGAAVPSGDAVPAVATRSALRGLWRPLILAALVLLLLEAAAFHRRWRL